MQQYLYDNLERDNFLPVAAVAGLVEAGSAIFGGKPEDKSTVGWQNYIATVPPLPVYPPKDVVLNAMRGVVPNDQYNSIANSYSDRDGVIVHGDWLGRVESVSPITIRWFKGAQETGLSRTSVSWQPATTPGSVAAGITNSVGGGINLFLIVGVALLLLWVLLRK